MRDGTITSATTNWTDRGDARALLDRRAYDHPLEDQPQIKAAWWAAAGLVGALMWLAMWAIIFKLVGVL